MPKSNLKKAFSVLGIDYIEKGSGHKYFKRTGSPGNYKYFYTVDEYRKYQREHGGTKQGVKKFHGKPEEDRRRIEREQVANQKWAGKKGKVYSGKNEFESAVVGTSLGNHKISHSTTTKGVGDKYELDGRVIAEWDHTYQEGIVYETPPKGYNILPEKKNIAKQKWNGKVGEVYTGASEFESALASQTDSPPTPQKVSYSGKEQGRALFEDSAGRIIAEWDHTNQEGIIYDTPSKATSEPSKKLPESRKETIADAIGSIEHWKGEAYQDGDEVHDALENMKSAIGDSDMDDKTFIESINSGVKDIERWKGQAYQEGDDVDLALQEMRSAVEEKSTNRTGIDYSNTSTKDLKEMNDALSSSERLSKHQMAQNLDIADEIIRRDLDNTPIKQHPALVAPLVAEGTYAELGMLGMRGSAKRALEEHLGENFGDNVKIFPSDNHTAIDGLWDRLKKDGAIQHPFIPPEKDGSTIRVVKHEGDTYVLHDSPGAGKAIGVPTADGKVDIDLMSMERETISHFKAFIREMNSDSTHPGGATPSVSDKMRREHMITKMDGMLKKLRSFDDAKHQKLYSRVPVEVGNTLYMDGKKGTVTEVFPETRTARVNFGAHDSLPYGVNVQDVPFNSIEGDSIEGKINKGDVANKLTSAGDQMFKKSGKEIKAKAALLKDKIEDKEGNLRTLLIGYEEAVGSSPTEKLSEYVVSGMENKIIGLREYKWEQTYYNQDNSSAMPGSSSSYSETTGTAVMYPKSEKQAQAARDYNSTVNKLVACIKDRHKVAVFERNVEECKTYDMTLNQIETLGF